MVQNGLIPVKIKVSNTQALFDLDSHRTFMEANLAVWGLQYDHTCPEKVNLTNSTALEINGKFRCKLQLGNDAYNTNYLVADHLVALVII